MTKPMKAIKVFGNEIWDQYLNDRLVEYHSGVCAQSELNAKIVEARLAAPNQFSLDNIFDKELSHRFIERTRTKHSGWTLRQDFFELGVALIQEMAEQNTQESFFGWHEFAKPEDAFLKTEQHHIHNGAVFFSASIFTDSLEKITKTLRKSRRTKLLGIVGNRRRGPCSLVPGSLFITDVFDCDMIVVCKLG